LKLSQTQEIEKKLTFNATVEQSIALDYLFDNETREVGYGGGAGGGKSILGAFWVWSMCNTYTGVRYFFGRNELKRLKQTTLVSYFEFCDLYKIPACQRGKYNEQKSSITFENGSSILLLDLKYKPSDPLGATFGSLLFTGGFIDESYEITYKYIEVLYSRIGRWKNAEYGIKPKILEASNPDKGHFNNRFYVPNKTGALPGDRVFVRALAMDRLRHPTYFRNNLKLHKVDVGTAAGIYVENLLKLSENMQQRLLWGNFEYDDDPSRMLDFQKIQKLFQKKDKVDFEDRALICDIAGRGSDDFITGVFFGRTLIDIEIINKSGGREVFDKIKEKAKAYSIIDQNIIYDGDGIGAFVGGEGGFIPSARPFNNGSRPSYVKADKKNNLKSYCAFRFVQFRDEYDLSMIKGESKIRLEKELSVLKKIEVDGDLKVQGIIPKSMMKEILGFSPDILDVLIMREYAYCGIKYTGDAEHA